MKTTMRYEEDAVDIFYECIAHNIPISRIIARRQGQQPRQHWRIFLPNHRLKR
jgi:hypothetical protein